MVHDVLTPCMLYWISILHPDRLSKAPSRARVSRYPLCTYLYEGLHSATKMPPTRPKRCHLRKWRDLRKLSTRTSNATYEYSPSLGHRHFFCLVCRDVTSSFFFLLLFFEVLSFSCRYARFSDKDIYVQTATIYCCVLSPNGGSGVDYQRTNTCTPFVVWYEIWCMYLVSFRMLPYLMLSYTKYIIPYEYLHIFSLHIQPRSYRRFLLLFLALLCFALPCLAVFFLALSLCSSSYVHVESILVSLHNNSNDKQWPSVRILGTHVSSHPTPVLS